jgi:hypothetical protein
MTEAAWLACAEPRPMLDYLEKRGQTSERKLRLFACACCRRIWGLLPDQLGEGGVEVAERQADGLASKKEIEEAHLGAFHEASYAEWLAETEVDYTPNAHAAKAVAFLYVAATDPFGQAAWQVQEASGWVGWWEAQDAANEDAARQETEAAERAWQAALLRDIFGVPQRPLPPRRGKSRFEEQFRSCLAWNGGTVSHLAQVAYNERILPSGHLDPARLAILADALEEAGCTERAIIDHLRDPGVHVRGCFVVDLVLGRA